MKDYKVIFSKRKKWTTTCASSCIWNISQMKAIDRSILKIYIKMHSKGFFSHLQKYKTCHCDMLSALPKDLVYQSQMSFQSLLTIQ